MSSLFVGKYNRLRVFVALVLVLTSILSSLPIDTVHATGEQYRWLDRDNIEATAGNFGSTAVRFTRSAFNTKDSRGQPITISRDKGFVHETGSADPGFPGPAGQNCVLRIGLEVSSANPSVVTIHRDIDAELVAASAQLTNPPPCDSPALVSIAPFAQTATASNTDQSDGDEQARDITVRITTAVRPSESYARDVITLKVVGSGRVLGQKNVGAANAYSSADAKGFKTNITFRNTLIRRTDNIEACSQYIAKCVASIETRQSLDISGLTAITINKVYAPETNTDGTCEVKGVGWLVCPVMTFLGGMNDAAFGFLANSFLETNVSYLKVGGDTYNAWSLMRNVANVAFVIAFMIIIYSQITGAGLSNYGLKKMIPKLIVSAILVNISFFVCQIAVDLSNILGYSVKSLFDSFGGLIQVGATTGDVTNSGFQTAGLIATIIAGGAILLMALSIPLLLASLLALIVILFILLARTALIILLIVISPLAFVAYLLPNTEDWFQKWRKTFTTLLLLFPIIAAVFGASSFAAQIVLNAATAGDTKEQMQLIALGIATIPLFAVPVLLKGAMTAAGSIGAKLASASTKANSRATGAAKSKATSRMQNSRAGQFLKYRSEQGDKRRALTQVGAYTGRNPIRRGLSGLNRRLNNNARFNQATGGFGAQADLSRQAEQRKDAKEATEMFGGDYDLASEWAATGGDIGAARTRGNLSDAQLQQFQRMRSANHHRKAASHLAAAQILSENGQGDGATVRQALDNAAAAGADTAEVSSATHTAIAAFRGNGRGDAAADLNNLTPGTAPMTQEQGWAQVDPSKIHRAGLVAGSAGRISYVNHINGDREATRKALAGLDSMEGRARNLVEGDIVAAAQAHQYTETGVAPTITTVQDAKAYFNVK